MSYLHPAALSAGSSEMERQPKTMGEVIRRLFNSKKHCDVTFTFRNLPDRIEAHELLLSARSPVFDEMFQNLESGDRMIEITETTPTRFQTFLEFIYADKFPSFINTNAAGALDLLHLAHKYKVQPLADKCEELLKSDVYAKNCVGIFEVAGRYGLQELKNQAGDAMVTHLAFLIGDSSLANAEENTIMYLLRRDDLNVKEAKLFEFVYEWGGHQIAPSESHELLKDRVKRLVSEIRFTNMTTSEISNVVLPSGLLTIEELDAVNKYIRAVETARRNAKIRFNMNPRRADKAIDGLKTLV